MRYNSDTNKSAIGSIYAMSSRIIFLFCAFSSNIFLARWFNPEMYGLYGLTMSILVWIELTVLAGISSTYRKVISEDENLVGSVLYSIIRLFIPYCLFVTAALFAATPLISKIFNDSRLQLLLLIAGIDIPAYGIFYAYLNILNGRRHFIKENFSLSVYALSKVIFVVLFVLFAGGLQGALIGNILGSLCGFLLAFSFVKRMQSSDGQKKIVDLKPRIVSFGLPYLFYIITVLLIINIDLWFVKALLQDDNQVAFYLIAYNLSKPLLFFLNGIATVMFPSFSRAVSAGDILLSQKYIRQTMRWALLFLLPITVMLGSTSEELITLLFSSKYASASDTLKILLAGISLFSIFSLFLNFIAAKNKPLHSFIISLCLIPIAVSLNYFLINHYGINGAAKATSIVSGIGVIIAGVYLWKEFGAFINFSVLLRVVGATGSMYLIGQFINTAGYYLLLKYIILTLTHTGVLLMLGEIKKGDLIIISDTLSRANSFFRTLCSKEKQTNT